MKVIGSRTGMERLATYHGIEWRFHSEYYGKQIWRAYHLGGGPCALYKVDTDGVTIVAENLLGVKHHVRAYLQGGDGQ